MTATIGQRVTGHIGTTAGRVEFTGTITATYRTGGKDAVNVACDDSQERTALAENVTAAENVTSVRGGKTHLSITDSPVPFPLCTSGSRNTYTKYRWTTAPITCRECAGILARRAARMSGA